MIEIKESSVATPTFHNFSSLFNVKNQLKKLLQEAT